MLKAAGEDGTRWMTELCNAVVRDGKIPKDWSRNWFGECLQGEGRCTGMWLIKEE